MSLRGVQVCVVLTAVALAAPAWALDAAEAVNAATRGHEHLGMVKVIRGTRTSFKYVTVNAGPTEAWTAGAEGAFVTVSPTTRQVGPGRVQVTLATQGLTGDGPFTGAVVVTPDGGGTAVRIPVALDVWPRDVSDLPVGELKRRANWPGDGDFVGGWEMWGFLPDEVSHPGEHAGVNLVAEETTPCAAGQTANCTRVGQAGLTAGQSADRAWLLSRGDERVMVAVLDSGIRWHERSVQEKLYLNAAELRTCPPPGATPGTPATYDVNGDGIFNIRDYDWASPPYVDVNQNGRLDPQDLIHGVNPVTQAPCSDSVDDDGNGYVDDISGWDFFWNDNDACDDTDYGHGTGEAKDSVAQGHDDDGPIGICMRCTLLPVRVGDSFIADVNQFAEGVTFAVDTGASVVQEALGTLNYTPFAQAAIDYAWTHNAMVVASAADETSRHHNPPANGEHVINVHAITYDTDGAAGWRAATSFLNFNNCTNYGGHLHLSTPGSSCSSEATGKTSGQTGLLYSYYLQLRDTGDGYFSTPLTAGEVFQLLIQSADDIDVTGAETDAAALALQKYPSNEGWDEAFGYGRNNARRSLEMIRDKEIPPQVYVDSPRWFEQFDPVDVPSLDVTGSVAVTRDAQASWVLELAKGIEPRDADFSPVANGVVMQGTPRTGSLGHIALAGLFDDVETPSLDIDKRTLTLRLKATVTRGDKTLRSEFRKVFSVLHDPQRRKPLALFLGASGEASPRFSDVDGDGRDELVLPTSDGLVHAFRGDGTELPGWPAKLNRYGSFRDDICNSTDARTRAKCHRTARAYQSIDTQKIYSATVGAAVLGDLEGSGGPEKDVVVSDMDGFVYAFGANGRLLPGWPVHMDPDHVSEFVWGKLQRSEARFAEEGFFAQPVLVDLDRDGALEVVVSGMDQWVYAWHADGSPVLGWPVNVYNHSVEIGPMGRYDDRIVAPVTVAFLDGKSGPPSLLVGTEELINNTASSYLYALDAQGNSAPEGAIRPGFPVILSGFVNDVLPYVGRGMPNTVVAADLTGDGVDEFVASGMGGALTRLDKDGHENGDMAAMATGVDYFGPLNNTNEGAVASLINNPSIADLNGDGRLDVINGTAGLKLAGSIDSGGLRIPFQHSVSAWDLASGLFLDGFPQVVEDYQFFMNYAVGDLDGDGKPEAVGGNGVYMVHAFNSDGKEPAGFPKNTHGWVAASPALGDMDADNHMEVAVHTRDGWLFVWNMPGRVQKKTADETPAPIQWSGFQHDEQGTGNVGTALRNYGVDAVPKDDAPSKCACAVLPLGTPFGAWLVLAAGMLVIRRRRGA